ncbi:hypothetical protein [Streptomyces sp. NPDC051776]|uniref:hypothetical protein n=1 Tax=Streptomyces sp. NPDC051776 TaxID=3155414 RepID=UPI00341A3F71
MELHKITRAALVAVAMGGLASTGCGIAFAGDHGAEASGGSSAGADVFQQNTAQESRQNNNCDSSNGEEGLASPTGSRGRTRCATGDTSFNQGAVVAGGGAHADGGSNLSGDVSQQNTAQKGRQNNDCANPNDTSITLEGSGVNTRCASEDGSRNRYTRIHSGGATTFGGSASGSISQQNAAQDGRQNNHCDNPNLSVVTASGGRAQRRCGNVDGSGNAHTLTQGGGAHTDAGSSPVVFQQNAAQEGRQNNHCAHLTNGEINLTGGRVDDKCVHKDVSRNRHAVTREGRARTEGSSNEGGVNLNEQNAAQEGRQNNSCASDSAALTVSGGRLHRTCASADASENDHTLTTNEGADASAGSGGSAVVFDQNTAQEGRQNNSCADLNSADFEVTGGRATGVCSHSDASRNQHVLSRGGGATADGGSSAGGNLIQQNTAQEGRQNNRCASPNDTDIELTGGDLDSRCATRDHSASVKTAEIGGGADAAGGSGAMRLAQQNTAQEGRQNNHCANPNGLTLTTNGSRARSQCAAIDNSRNVGSIYR